MTDIAEFDIVRAGRRVAGHGLDAWFAEARELLKLAAPLVLTQLSQMAIMTTDVVMLGRLGKTALACLVGWGVLFAGFAVCATFVSFAWSDQSYVLPAIAMGIQKACDDDLGLRANAARPAAVFLNSSKMHYA